MKYTQEQQPSMLKLGDKIGKNGAVGTVIAIHKDGVDIKKGSNVRTYSLTQIEGLLKL